jgi:hypothetical protein
VVPLAPLDSDQQRADRQEFFARVSAAGKGGFYLYDLKRTGMLEVRSAGVPEDLAMRLSGHRTKETYRRYAYGDADDLRAELRKADAYRAARRRKPNTPLTATLRTFSSNISDSLNAETRLSN